MRPAGTRSPKRTEENVDKEEVLRRSEPPFDTRRMEESEAVLPRPAPPGRRRRLVAVVAGVAVAIAAAGASLWFLSARRPCSCVDFDASVGGLHALAKAHWQHLDWKSLSAAWPGAVSLPCGSHEGAGLDAVAEGVKSCCASCGTCGGLAFTSEGPDAGTLWSIPMTVCRRSFEATVTDLRELVDATVPDKPEASVGGDTWTPDNAEHSYKWRTATGRMVLSVHVYQGGDGWVGIFDLRRCEPSRPASIAEKWDVGTASPVEVIEAKVAEQEGKKGRRLAFSYWSECLSMDWSCQAAEFRSLWPRLRKLADAPNVSSIRVRRRSCTGLGEWSIGRDQAGRWDVASWIGER